MKRIVSFVLFCGVFFLYIGQVYAQDAVAIMTAAKNRTTYTTIQTRSRMVITASNGSTSQRVIDQYSKDDASGNNRKVIVFPAGQGNPASIENTRFLTMDNSNGTDQWIYLPELRRVRRIDTSESSNSFMGTDFSYDDISAMERDVSLDTHTLLREETLNGKACYVIQSVSKNSGYQYSKMITWIDKQDSLVYKSELYDRRGTLVKIMEMMQYQEVQGRLIPMQTKISTVASGSSTTINMDTNFIRYDGNIPESVFTTRYLETGRTQ